MQTLRTFPNVFKKDSTGKIRVWSMELGTDGEGGYFHRTIAGIQDGKLVTSGWTACEAKNVGRSNATLPDEQAEKEIENLYERKLELTYFRNVEDVDTVRYTEPMLATDYTKRKHMFDIMDGVWAQPKLDGIRCIARADGLWTRKGKQIVSCPHIEEALAPFFAQSPDAVLDGELYNHYFSEDFNRIASIVRKLKPTPSALARSAQFMEYHIYDWVVDKPFAQRTKAVKNVVEAANNPMIVAVESRYLSKQNLLDELYAEWIAQGYEGQMVRFDMPGYAVGKRSPALMKRKEFQTEEFPVLRMEEGAGNWSGAVKKFVVRLEDGTENDATPRGSHDMLADMLQKGITPKWATVRFFGRTPDGKLRFPVAVDWGFGDSRTD